ncbi:hypothetical protein V8G57_17070 [Collimonas sp. H4R21]|uniref:Uncharacterized protein n=1 Tax=Collimonas rhizosphaerae TaxID=3126357 RepID=A0ABU9PYP4_9BURK
MNLFPVLFGTSPSPFEQALVQRDGPGGRDATILKLQQAEMAARAYFEQGVTPIERASLQAYIDVIACARNELEKFTLKL